MDRSPGRIIRPDHDCYSRAHARTMSNPLNYLVLYCRAGFEAECAREIQERANEAGCFGFPRTEKGRGYVVFETWEPDAALRLVETVSFHTLIFTRQWLVSPGPLPELPDGDRVTPVVEAARRLGPVTFRYLEVEAADTDEAKPLLNFCRKFTAPLAAGLREAGLLEDDREAPTLHLFLQSSRRGYLGYSLAGNRSPHPMGIPRLRFPRRAPSRSTLKLEEAWLHFLTPQQREEWLQPEMTAVDLGAAPGGWTWQLVKRHIRVTAVDNGPMDDELMDSGIVNHIREDGFRYRPEKSVDWLVCDMVERPLRIAELMGQWLKDDRCRFAIFNLKLPMKQRYEVLQDCLELLRETLEAKGADYALQARQLYHDREEVTVFARLP